MRVYLDTEFADWDDPATDLISLGMVAEDGREFYAESAEFERRRCTNFVKFEVLPQLGAPGVLRLNTSELKQAVLAWTATIPNPEIAVDYDGDWKLLSRLLEPDVPAGLVVTNIYKQIDKQALEDYFVQHGLTKHHALHDARALRFAADDNRRSENAAS